MTSVTIHSQIILSEALADPAAIPDAQGEFLEVANAGADTVRAESLIVVVDGDSLRTPLGRLAPGSPLLLCRDSLRAENGGMACDRELKRMSLANFRPLQVTIFIGGLGGASPAAGPWSFIVPAARAGVSWENTFEADQGYARFLASAYPAPDGDSASPGLRNSRSVLPARHDLALVDAAWSEDGQGAALLVRVKNAGSEIPASVSLTVTQDWDWDGTPDFAFDSLSLPWASLPDGPAGAGKLFRYPLPAATQGILQVTLGRDENPGNDALRILRAGGKSLEISEVCPAPDQGPEWLEIRNAGTRALSLAQVAVDGAALGKAAGSLAPGEYLAVAADAKAFQVRFGSAQARVLGLSAWPTLRNTGDTVRLSAAGFAVDSLAYAGKPGYGECLVRGRDGTAVAETAGPTPGFEVAPETELSWDVSPRVLRAGNTMAIEVRMPSPGSYRVRVFDLEGNCVKDLGGGGPGRRVHAWTGEGRAGRLRPGPYILCLSADGRRARKLSVVVAD